MNVWKILILSALLIVAASVAFAEEKAEPVQDAEAISGMSGNDLYKSFCKSCHTEDAESGEYTPMSLIVEQWEEFFDDGFAETHGEVACPSDPEKMVTDLFDKDMLKKIRKFCVDHAADSEQPMTCG